MPREANIPEEAKWRRPAKDDLLKNEKHHILFAKLKEGWDEASYSYLEETVEILKVEEKKNYPSQVEYSLVAEPVQVSGLRFADKLLVLDINGQDINEKLSTKLMKIMNSSERKVQTMSDKYDTLGLWSQLIQMHS